MKKYSILLALGAIAFGVVADASARGFRFRMRRSMACAPVVNYGCQPSYYRQPICAQPVYRSYCPPTPSYCVPCYPMMQPQIILGGPSPILSTPCYSQPTPLMHGTYPMAPMQPVPQKPADGKGTEKPGTGETPDPKGEKIPPPDEGKKPLDSDPNPEAPKIIDPNPKAVDPETPKDKTNPGTGKPKDPTNPGKPKIDKGPKLKITNPADPGIDPKPKKKIDESALPGKANPNPLPIPPLESSAVHIESPLSVEEKLRRAEAVAQPGPPLLDLVKQLPSLSSSSN